MAVPRDHPVDRITNRTRDEQAEGAERAPDSAEVAGRMERRGGMGDDPLSRAIGLDPKKRTHLGQPRMPGLEHTPRHARARGEAEGAPSMVTFEEESHRTRTEGAGPVEIEDRTRGLGGRRGCAVSRQRSGHPASYRV